MTARVVFETASIADSIRKAESIAPDKGAAFDKVAGIVLHVDIENKQVVLRSTNLDVFYMEWTTPLDIVGASTVWRLPSRILAAFVSSLPIGSGNTVEFSQAEGSVKIVSGRTTCSLRLIDHSSYPFWEPFDEIGMSNVSDLGARIDQIEWAASKDVHALGLRLNGETILATNRYRLAQAPLKIEGLQEPITIPPSTLSLVLKKMGDVRAKASHNQLLVMPDSYTQIMTVMIGEPFPPVDRIMRRDYTERITFKRQYLIDMIGRTTKISSNRFPVLRLFIGQEELATMMTDDERGFIGDVISVTGQGIHPRVEMRYDPDNVIAALTNCPSDSITLCYDPTAPKKALAYLYDGAGYEVWLAPRGDAPKKEGTP